MKRAGLSVLLFVFVSVSFGQEGGTPNSEWMYVGSTWWDVQTQGSVGRMIATSEFGVHFVWTQANLNFTDRQAYYNCLDLGDDSLGFEHGTRVDNGGRSGFPVVSVLPDGFTILAYHVTGDNWTNIKPAVEFLPYIGGFMLNDVDWPRPLATTVYAKMDVDEAGRIHLAGSLDENFNIAFYRRGYPFDPDGLGWWIDWETEPRLLSTGRYVGGSVDIVHSPDSDRVAAAWIEDPIPDYDAENIYMSISEDGGYNWSNTVSVTNLPPVDTNCTASPEICNGDTLRPWHDLSIILDDDDNVHIAFSARGYYYFDTEGEPNPASYLSSTIWHWSSETEEFSLIGEAWSPPDNGIELGTNNLMCQEPSLAIDTLTGSLYCGFQQFDRHAYGVGGYAMSEYYASVSTDNGRSWALPTNVSNTPGEANQPEGEHPCERDITLAKYVTDGFIHAQYLHDYSAGTCVSSEGVAVLCSLVYMKTPVTDIPTTPLNPPWEFRATGTPVSEEEVALPAEFMLYQNYPNPFNPSTNIQFDLARAGVVKLVVFDVIGREVATLVDNARMNAGVHTVAFDGAELASGVYLARLEMDGTSMTRKMVLLK